MSSSSALAMHAPASRRQPSARSRMLSSAGSARARRDLGDVLVHGVSIIVHDASHVAHDVGHAVDHALSGQVSKVPADLVKTGIDLVKTGKDALEVVTVAQDPSNNHDSGGPGTGTGDQSHSGGGEGGTQPRPPPAPGSGGGEGTALGPSHPVSSSTATPPASSMSASSGYPAPAPSTSANAVPGAANVASNMPSGNSPVEPMDPPAQADTGPTYGNVMEGMPPAPSSIASDTQSLTTTTALPSNSSSAAAAHRKGFPLAAAAALGAVLGFLVVSLLFWAVWLYLRKRRRVYLPPKRMLSVTSGRTVSTVPLFISASEAGVKDENPFKHPRDADEDEGDPFDAASLWRSSTTRSASKLSV